MCLISEFLHYFSISQNSPLRNQATAKYTADSGVASHEASAHRMSKILHDPQRNVAKGVVEVAHEAAFGVNELDKFVNIMLVDDPPASLSVGTLCEELEYFYSWKPREHPQLAIDGVTV